MRILAAVLAGLFSIGLAPETSALEIVAPKEIKPGDVFFIEIKDSLGKDLVGGKFDGEPLKLFRWGDKFGALVGVDVATKEGEKEIMVEEFAPGDAPSMTWRYRVRVLKPDFPEVKVERKKPNAVEQKRIKKEKDLIRQALQKSGNDPLWEDWFGYPLESTLVSRGGEFGLVRKSALGSTHHAGVDFGGKIGAPVRSSNTGRVVLVGNFLLEGKIVIVDHGLGLFSLYMHLDSAAVGVGDSVAKGVIIGALGKTGRATGPNLHFAFLLGGKRIDPVGLLKLGEGVRTEEKEKTVSLVQQERGSWHAWVEAGKKALDREPIYYVTSKVKRVNLVGRGKNRKRVTKYIEAVVSKEILLAVGYSAQTVKIVRLEVAVSGSLPRRNFTIRKVTPEDCDVEKISGGGVNTNFKIVCGGEERKVRASAHILFDDKESTGKLSITARKVIYIPYADWLVEPLSVLIGRLYLESQIKKADEELRRLEVRSRAADDKLVADIFPRDLLFNLSLIEHIDHDEFAARGAVYTGEKVLVQLALNQENTFHYAISRAGALCLMQIMPATYREIRKNYPEAKLSPRFIDGSCDHKEAIKTAYLVLDDKLANMPLGLRRSFLREPEKYGVYLAAAYNGGAFRATTLYYGFKPDGLERTLKDFFLLSSPQRKNCRILCPETWFFIKKYMEIAKEFLEE